MSRAHLFWNKASLTVLFFPDLLIAEYSAGANLHSGPTSAQLSVHSKVEEPSPSAAVMLIADMAATGFSSLDGNAAQQRPGSDLRSHSQRSLKAKPKNRRSKIPRPPRSVGRQTMGHATLHLPPVVVVAPDQRKALRRLSICSIAHDKRQQAMLVCTGIADSVTLVRSR
jgi:hypothetical protein